MDRLDWAIRNRNPQAVALLKEKFDLTVTDCNGRTPLELAKEQYQRDFNQDPNSYLTARAYQVIEIMVNK